MEKDELLPKGGARGRKGEGQRPGKAERVCEHQRPRKPCLRESTHQGGVGCLELATATTPRTQAPFRYLARSGRPAGLA